MKKLGLLFCLVCLLFEFSIAQTYRVTGRVVDANQHPLVGVNITVSSSTKGTQTNESGAFVLENLSSSKLNLRFSFVGFRTLVQKVDLLQQNVDLGVVVLQESNENLDEVVVAKERTNRFTEKQSEYVAKMPLKNLENPQVYNVVNAELLEEQLVVNFDDALKNVPGMQKLWESTGRGNDGAGYYSMRGFSIQPTLMNGLPALTHGSPDPANIEAIEVMKGPSGTLYGSSLISYGGLINIVTKKPYESFGGEFTYLTGSYGLNRLTADVNLPLDEEGKVLFRLNTAYHYQNSWQDAGYRKSFFVAPTLSYQASERLSFLVVAELMQNEQTNQTMLFLNRSNALTFANIDEMPYDPKRSYTSNNLPVKNPAYSLQAQMNYKLSSAWTSQTAVSRSLTKALGYYSYLYESINTNTVTYLPNGAVFARYVSDQNATTDVTDIQQNFIGDFKVGGLRNRMVVGFDFMQRNYINNSTGYTTNGLVYIGSDDAQTVYDVVYGGETVSNFDSGVLSKQAMDALLEGVSVSNSITKEKVFGAYVSDVVNVSKALSVMASLRVDRFEGDPESDEDDQTAFSPKFGITYQPILDKLTVFANYMDGFSNVASQTVSDADGSNQRTKSFDPEHANQAEIGVKTSLWEDRLSASLSYYDIKVRNKVMTDPDNPRDYLQDGEVESKGVELSVIANPFSGFNAVLGYSFNDSEVVSGADGVVGTRPLEAGPENTFNFWASYRLQSGSLDGLGAGFGLNYIGENNIINYAATGTFTLPAYTILNASVFYEMDKFRLALKLDNLSDVEYYSGWSTINPQRPRTLSASFAYRF
ncbi:TonB-dependent receptor [Mangrovibacterium diazotrophicum]|uniref:Iron complex outermembrane receptor protein n=1 Tax=Mangrovibacterium diazotrophicum TaxID=1261403 RepID=A0A419W8P9_9BACT|nr:TonB-dependent receptor [Mangrovibacterium diazotrophicum]RKD91848.1 iron complex outermembrane receptor protein [Mangrovibacterium diazotrophicum]